MKLLELTSLKRRPFPVDVEVIPGRLVPTEALRPLPNLLGLRLAEVVCHPPGKNLLHGGRIKIGKIISLASTDFRQ